MSDAPDEGAPAPDPTPDYGGASQDEITQALDMFRGLNNLDTRGQYLEKVVRPEYDGQFLRQMGQPAEAEAEPNDPWATYNEQYNEQAQYEEPQYEQPQFDPSTLPQMLQPVLDTNAQEIERRVFERLGQMAQDQSIRDSSESAAKFNNLPPSTAALIEQQVRAQQQMNPNRQAGELAKEAAAALATELLQWKATPPPTPPPSSAVPSGPSPDTLQKPRTVEEAMEHSRMTLNP